MPCQATVCTRLCYDLAGIDRRFSWAAFICSAWCAHAWRNKSFEARHYKHTAQDSIHTTCLSLDSAEHHSHTDISHTLGSHSGPRLIEASALTVDCHTSLCIHGHPIRKGKVICNGISGEHLLLAKTITSRHLPVLCRRHTFRFSISVLLSQCPVSLILPEFLYTFLCKCMYALCLLCGFDCVCSMTTREI